MSDYDHIDPMGIMPWDHALGIAAKGVKFEGIKAALRQDKNGFNLTLVIHPDDVPDEIMRDFVGSRYEITMVRLDENEAPYVRDRQNKPSPSAGPKPEKTDGQRLVTSCAMLCQEKNFQLWLMEKGYADMATEDEAARVVRDMLGVQSRSELKDNPEAQRKWIVIRSAYGEARSINF